jgi:hypothetical protein
MGYERTATLCYAAALSKANERLLERTAASHPDYESLAEQLQLGAGQLPLSVVVPDGRDGEGLLLAWTAATRHDGVWGALPAAPTSGEWDAAVAGLRVPLVALPPPAWVLLVQVS